MSGLTQHSDSGLMRRKPLRLLLTLFLILWLTHTLGYLVHEYAHSFTAWVLGYKANPVALNYGHLNVQNVLLLSDVDENVDYAPVFAAGKAHLAALIAIAGVLFGNGVFYLYSRWLYVFSTKRGSQLAGLFAFLFCLMNAGNFLSYVPVRTFATHADMSTVEKGLKVSPLWPAIVLGFPFALALWHLFARMLPDACKFLFPDRRLAQINLTALTSFMVFGFFGSAGMYGYGSVSHCISMVSFCLALPLALILCWPRRAKQVADAQVAAASSQ